MAQVQLTAPDYAEAKKHLDALASFVVEVQQHAEAQANEIQVALLVDPNENKSGEAVQDESQSNSIPEGAPGSDDEPAEGTHPSPIETENDHEVVEGTHQSDLAPFVDPTDVSVEDDEAAR